MKPESIELLGGTLYGFIESFAPDCAPSSQKFFDDGGKSIQSISGPATVGRRIGKFAGKLVVKALSSGFFAF